MRFKNIMGEVIYFRNHKRHRIGLPAEDTGILYWFFNGYLHRINGKYCYFYGISGGYRLHGGAIKLNTSKLVL